jgi:hypothetical protein
VTATALGSDGNLYVGALKSANIWRITSPRADPRSGQSVSVIARTTDGLGINGSMAFLGDDLYIPENRGLAMVSGATQCVYFGCGSTRLSLANVATANSVASDGTAVYVAALPAPVAGGLRGGGGGGGVLAPTTIWRYDPGSQSATAYETQGMLPAFARTTPEDCFRGDDPSIADCDRPVDPWINPGQPTGLFFVLGMYVDPASHALYIGDDPLAGKRFGTGRIWKVQ